MRILEPATVFSAHYPKYLEREARRILNLKVIPLPEEEQAIHQALESTYCLSERASDIRFMLDKKYRSPGALTEFFLSMSSDDLLLWMKRKAAFTIDIRMYGIHKSCCQGQPIDLLLNKTIRVRKTHNGGFGQDGWWLVSYQRKSAIRRFFHALTGM